MDGLDFHSEFRDHLKFVILSDFASGNQQGMETLMNDPPMYVRMFLEAYIERLKEIYAMEHQIDSPDDELDEQDLAFTDADYMRLGTELRQCVIDMMALSRRGKSHPFLLREKPLPKLLSKREKLSFFGKQTLTVTSEKLLPGSRCRILGIYK